MRNKKLHIVRVIIFFSLFLPSASHATGNNDVEIKQNTEIEKQSPELFTLEVTNAICLEKEVRQSLLNQLGQQIFKVDMKSNEIVEDTKRILFTENYTSTVDINSSNHKLGHKSQTSFLIGLVVITLSICSVIYLLLSKFANRRKLNDEQSY